MNTEKHTDRDVEAMAESILKKFTPNREYPNYYHETDVVIAMIEMFKAAQEMQGEESDAVYEEVVREIYGEDVLTTDEMIANLKSQFTIIKKKQQ